jgi:hypothetical protein
MTSRSSLLWADWYYPSGLRLAPSHSINCFRTQLALWYYFMMRLYLGPGLADWKKPPLFEISWPRDSLHAGSRSGEIARKSLIYSYMYTHTCTLCSWYSSLSLRNCHSNERSRFYTFHQRKLRSSSGTSEQILSPVLSYFRMKTLC